jgi:hypothetical protein
MDEETRLAKILSPESTLWLGILDVGLGLFFVGCVVCFGIYLFVCVG